MTDRAICYGCINDDVLSSRVESEGEPQLCEVCGEEDKKAFSYAQLGEALEPVVREHFKVGPMVRQFYEDDTEGWEQEGEMLSDVVQMVLGQDVEAPDELVSAVADAEDWWPADGDEQFYDGSQLFVPRKVTPHLWMADWHALKAELAHRRRFFSERARTLFGRLFQDVASIDAYDEQEGKWKPVISELPEGTEILRARVVRSDSELRWFVESAPKELGAPPAAKASAGRMNAAGIAVFYGAMDQETCVAEMRPALGGRVLVGAFRTTRPLKILDFRRLEAATLGELSYFDPKYAEQRERAVFLRRLRGLISRPVVPGHEDEYLVTQTLAEYLAHVHSPPFDGIFFGSVQKEGGANIVLFGRSDDELVIDVLDAPEPVSTLWPAEPQHEVNGDQRFPVEYVDGSAKLFATRSIEYQHQQLTFSIGEDYLFVHDGPDDYEDGDWG